MNQIKTIEADIVIAGGGCAGLSLALAIQSKPALQAKKIIILEKDLNKANDRTWCFWEEGKGKLDHILDAQWKDIYFGYAGKVRKIPLNTFTYKLIRGEQFYNYAYQQLSQLGNVDIIRSEVTDMKSEGDKACFYTPTGEVYSGTIGFNSLPPKLEPDVNSLNLLQHFKGWWVEADRDVFDDKVATLMDFNIEQEGECRFVYVLPLSAKKALIEYTIFSENLLSSDAYNSALNTYISKNYADVKFQIAEEEFGVIPMSSRDFPIKHSAKIWNIGTAGGQTKASTGYTFYNIQKQSHQIAEALAKGVTPIENTPFLLKRFGLYDNTLLHVLHYRMVPGSKVFDLMFKKNPVESVFRFLSNESNFIEELRIMSSVPIAKFLPAAIKELAKKISLF